MSNEDIKTQVEEIIGPEWMGHSVGLEEATTQILKLINEAREDKTERAILFLADCIDALENIKDRTVITRRQAAEEILRRDLKREGGQNVSE